MKRTCTTLLLVATLPLVFSACARSRCRPSPCGGAPSWRAIEPVPTGGVVPTPAVSAAPGAARPSATEETAQRLHGYRFQSLSCTDEGCGGVLSALAHTCGINVFVTPAARARMGKVSLDLQDATMAQALDAITSANGLTWSETGPNVVTIDVPAGSAPAAQPAPAQATPAPEADDDDGAEGDDDDADDHDGDDDDDDDGDDDDDDEDDA